MSKRILLFTCLILFSVFSIAQTKVVSGKVTDENGSAMPGVSVIQKGSKLGTQTDQNGNYTINITGSRTELVFSYIGYKSTTMSADGKENISLALQKDISSGEEVVVIGYQSIKRKNLLASVSSVSARDIKDIPINSAAEALNGRLAGVTASTSEGSPDAQITVRVRGGMSISQDNSPLYIIDGVQVESGLTAISPQDIQTIDVLKDAAATAIYGARGANGVIVITTKSGRKGRLIVGYNGFVGTKYLPKTLKVLSPYDFIVYQSERSRGSSADSTTFANNYGSTWDTLSNYSNQKAVDWQEEVFGNTGFLTTQNVTASGGSNKITYNFGYTYNEDKAVVLNSRFNRHLLNFKGDYKITKDLKFGLSTRYTNQDVYGAGVSSDQGSSYNRLRNAVKYRPFLSVGQNIDDQDQFADPNVANGLNLVNPIALANAEYRNRSTDAINLTANLSYNITKNLSFRTTFGYDNNKIIDREFSDSITPYSIIQGGRLPIADLDTLERKTITNSNVLTYTIQNFKNKHDFDFLLGQETYDLRVESRNSLFRNYPTFTSYDQAFKNTSLGTLFNGYPRIRESRYTNASFFGRVNYSYLDRYLFSFNMRADGASKFAPGKQWGYFPAGSFAWRVSKEKFMEKVDFISDLKFRVGFGEVGN
ncbi:MAG TPA: SusC/RagA family TonB-linked outer membrane protein, partial [Ferruginibacter sp.]|nr:SusC/RagA family TonB-linked outer membrane protein [Ferruginibacter sp.]